MNNRPATDTQALLRRSVATIKRLEDQLSKAQSNSGEPIAVIGIGCRFAGGADTPDKLWSLLEQGQDAVTEVPKDRWDVETVYDPDPDALGKSYARCGGFLDNVDKFDAAFFGITPREAVHLDPQQRLLLEVAYEALEHGGIAPSSLAGTQTGVYVGLTAHDYGLMGAMEHSHLHADAYAASGSSHSIAAGRLSYFFGVHGPNFAVDTACSASLVAVHSAVNALRSKEADIALAGGTTLILSELGSILTSRARMMSFKGRCQTFDANADGYVRSEGCAMIALKRKSDALRDGDRVLAYIRGSALNQDGRSTGMTAPNGRAQVQVLRSALRNAGLKPEEISYVEAHGTGTSLGDPIELKALGEVYGDRPSDDPLFVASLKTNIGHTEGAAGIAGIIKTVMALQHKKIPAHLHLNTPNPLIPWDNLPVVVPRETIDWPQSGDAPRRAGVSSFGFSGTNGHLILEEAMEAAPKAPGEDLDKPVLLTFSARNKSALTDAAARLAAHMRAQPQMSVVEVAAELALGRSHLASRLALTVTSCDDALEKLDAVASSKTPQSAVFGSALGGEPPEVAFLFTGQGSQFPGMAEQLYYDEPVFREALDRCDAVLADKLQKPLTSVIFGTGDAADAEILNDTAYTQPALFAVEWALSELWRSWGIVPAAVMGHSVGEYTAACVAGVFSMEEGLTLIAERGRLMSGLLKNGTMAAVFAPEETVKSALSEFAQDCAIAAVNGPNNTVISGQAKAVDKVLAILESNGVSAQKLAVSHAFHSPLMDPILDALESAASQIQFKPPQITLISNVTGKTAGNATYSAGYWRQHAREAVRFSDAIATLHSEGFKCIVELGPSATLVGMSMQCPGAERAKWHASLRKGRDDSLHIQGTAAELYASGQSLNWVNLFPDNSSPATRSALPTYPFQRDRYWRDPSLTQPMIRSSSGHPFLGDAAPGPIRTFRCSIGRKSTPWLGDHRLFDIAPFPAAGFLDLALSAAMSVEDDTVSLSDVDIREGLILPDERDLEVQVVVHPKQNGERLLEVFSQNSADSNAVDDWRLHMTARTSRALPNESDTVHADAPDTATDFPPADLYELFEDLGVDYGPAFRPIAEIRHTQDQVWGTLELQGNLNTSGFKMHPTLLDGCIQLLGVVLEAGDVSMPVSVRRFEILGHVPKRVSCVVTNKETNDPNLKQCSIAIFDPDGTQVAAVHDLLFRKITKSALMAAVAGQNHKDWLFEIDWSAAPIQNDERTEPPGNWLLLGDAAGTGERLADRLKAQGATVHLVTKAQALTDNRGIEQILGSACSDDQLLDAIVNLWPLDVTSASSLPDLETAHRELLDPALELAQALPDSKTRLWFVTRSAQSVFGEAPNLAMAPLNAFAGVVATEFPDTPCVRIDLDSKPSAHEDEMLFRNVWTPDREDQIALRGESRLAARLKSGQLSPAAESDPVLLDISKRGTLDGLTFVPFARSAPESDEVEVRILATGLNFRDVLNTLGMYPGDPGPLGSECAGVVTAIGDAVQDFAIGDEVVAMTDRSYATFVNVATDLVVKKPRNLTMAQAAATPVAYLTADYALQNLGRVKAGDSVLIHAITGGVGTAAAEIARSLGAKVYGTAGNPEKRAMALAHGAEFVADSRSLSFVDDIKKATDGEGVDFVLNSLANEFIPASLSLLRPGGRFVEIGKTDEWNQDRVTREFNEIEYNQLYLGEITAADSKLITSMLDSIYDQMDKGTLALPDVRAWPLDRAEEAFRFMAQGLHTGKIVLTQQAVSEIRADGCYLVTGGLRGIGLRTAQWLADSGARHLVLLGRSAPSDETRAVLDHLSEQGVNLSVQSVDVTDRAAMTSLITEIESSMPPLRGVIHCAGILDDAMLPDQTPEAMRRVMAPKVRGGYLLHELTRNLTLDFFVTYASGAGLLGAPGQANYAAANGFLDSLAHARRAQGLAALSLDWGSWSDIGMAARVDETHQRRWAAMGLNMIDPDAGVQMLEQAVLGAQSAQVALIPIIRDKLPVNAGPILSNLVVTRVQVEEDDDVDIGQLLAAAEPDKFGQVLADWLNSQVIRVLALDEHSGSDRDRSLVDFGMDSLMAMELHNRISAGLNVMVSAADLLKGPTLNQLTDTIIGELGDNPNAESETEWEEMEL